MSTPIPHPDRTGHEIRPPDSPIVIKVIAHDKSHNIYVMQDCLAADESITTGAYFVSGQWLEEMIHGYETGNWSYNL